MYILEKVGKSLQKLALNKMKDENPSVSILGVQLLITYMYVGKLMFTELVAALLLFWGM